MKNYRLQLGVIVVSKNCFRLQLGLQPTPSKFV
jgi:hypothetical protein